MSRIIGIIGAMELEVEKLIEAMEYKEEIVYKKRTFYKGTLEGTDVVLARCGVGKVNAALTVQMMVDKFGITDIINTGVAGSLNEKIDIGDIVLATNAVYHDMEEPLGGAEDRRDTVGRYAAFLQLPQVRRPELILHEDRHRGLQSLQELFRFSPRSERQVEYGIRMRVVLAHLVARRAEEGHDDFSPFAVGL